MGEKEEIYYSDDREYYENYECEGCRADRLGIMGCGSCPRNDERLREARDRR